MFSDRHVGKIAAGFWAGLVDHAKVAVEKDSPFPRIHQNSQGGRVGVGNGVKPGDRLGRNAEVSRDVFYLGFVDGVH